MKNRNKISAAAYKPMFVWLLFLASCSPKVNHLAYVTESTYRLDEKYSAKDEKIEQMIAPYRDQLAEKMDVPLATCSEEIFKQKPNSPLLNFVADAFLESAGEYSEKPIDIAVQNYGGIRVNSLPKGQLLIRHIYELMPFDNTLVLMDIEGKQLKLLFDRMADYGGWPLSRGSAYTIVDERYADHIVINSSPWEPDRIYRLALPDYIANGGDKCDFLSDVPKIDTGVLIRDLFIAYLKKHGAVPIDHEIRIHHEE